MKISNFNNEHVTPLPAKILQEEKKCQLICDFNNFNINLLNTDTDPQSFRLLRYFVFDIFCSLHFKANKVGKKLLNSH